MKIQLTNGMFATVDEIDADLAEFKWDAEKADGTFYAVRRVRKPGGGWKKIYMHHVIQRRMADPNRNTRPN